MTNTKTTKRALFASVLSLLLCISMLIGSTFAWFTDTATTGVNKIQAGTLDIALEMWDGEEWVNAEGKTLDFIKAEGAEDEEILWEPGCTYELPMLRVVNNGNLALAWDLKITGINGDAKLNEAIEWDIDVIVNAGAVGEQPLDELDWMASFFEAPQGGYRLYPADRAAENEYDTYQDTMKIAISGRMMEEAGNEYQALTIEGISVTVVATQLTHEYDSHGDEYDKDAQYPVTWSGNAANAPEVVDTKMTISTAEDLANFAASVNAGNNYAGITITLANDIDLKDGFWTPIGTKKAPFNGIFDGANHTVKNFVVDNKDESASCSSGLFGTGFNFATIKNLTVANATVTGYHYVGAVAGTVYGNIENCHVINSTINCINKNADANGDKAGLIVGYFATDSGTVSNCTAKDSSVSAGRDAGQIAGAAATAKVVNCSATNVTVTANGTGTGANINAAVIGRVLG